MSIATETTRIQNAKSALKTSIINKGVEVADTDLIDTYASKVDNLPSLTEDNALLEYANEVTGKEDTTLGDAVKTLADGYGQGGEDEYVKRLYERTAGEIVIPSYVTILGADLFSSFSSMTAITIPNSVTTIKNNVFMNCSGLSIITIPNSVTSIGQYVIRQTGIITLDMGSGITSLPGYCIWNNSKLTTIYMRSTTPPTILSNSITGNSKLSNIYVPSDSVDAYKSANNWSTYADIISAIEE